MLRFYSLIALLLLLSVPALAQDTVITPAVDSTPVVRNDTQKIVKPVKTYRAIDSLNSNITHLQLPIDSFITDTDNLAVSPLPAPKDSVSYRPLFTVAPWQTDNSLPLFIQVLQRHLFYNFTGAPVELHAEVKKFQGKETMFYVIAAFLLVFALLKQAFGKYFNDLFRVFFRTSMKQRQIRDQLIQSPLPSLLFNIFFVASTGLYITFLLYHFNRAPIKNFWLLYAYCCLGLAAIYIGKAIALNLIGWLLSVKKGAESYIFIVFIINKMIGIALLPFLVVLAFASDPVYTMALVVSWCGIGALLLYRFVLGFAAIRNEVRFNLFHFFLYLCAFELAPLLLIYKLLLLVF